MKKTKPNYKKISSGINNKYILLEDWTFKSGFDIPKDYEDAYVLILKQKSGAQITIKKGFVWDGATLAPDFKKVIPGTIIHDALYKRLCLISLWWKVPREDVRKWSDKVFNEVNKAFGFWRPIKRIYYRAVRIFGRFVRLFNRKS